jgi:N5-(cytidine 5'-diphosphoramidyl)-L-glutamine hydrolase
MTKLLVSQRIVVDPRHGERRDALDRRWAEFLGACGFLCVALPNRPGSAAAFAREVAPSGVLLTGGGDIAALGGDAPERDASEDAVLDWARRTGVKVFGVCRGFQFLLSRAGAELTRVEGHVALRHALDDGRTVNSFHEWSTRDLPPGWIDAVRAPDGTLEAARRADGSIAGQMWHPEREAPFDTRDIARIRGFFGAAP